MMCFLFFLDTVGVESASFPPPIPYPSLPVFFSRRLARVTRQSVMVAIGTNNLGAGMSARDAVAGVKAVVKVCTPISLLPRRGPSTIFPRMVWAIGPPPPHHQNLPANLFFCYRTCSGRWSPASYF